MLCIVMSGQCRWLVAKPAFQLLVSIVDSNLRLSRGRPGFDSPTGRASSFLLPNDPSKVSGAAIGHRRSFCFDISPSQRNGLAGNRTRVNLLEGTMLATIPPTHVVDVGLLRVQ